MDSREIRKLTKEKIADLISEKQIELINMKMNVKAGKDTKSHLLGILRKDIARLQTIYNEKQIIEVLEK